MLYAHYALGFVVFLASLVAIFYAPARRWVLYLLVLQIIVGAAVWGMLGVAPPLLHWILPLVVGGLYAAASAAQRRGGKASIVTGLCVLSALLVACVFYLGMHAVRG